MSLPYTDGRFEEVAGRWSLVAHEHTPGEVLGRSDDGDEFTLEAGGYFVLHVCDYERGRGWGGACACDRRVPVAVVEAAIRLARASR